MRTRTTAEAELQSAIAYYLDEGALEAALGLVDEFEAALEAIGNHPAIGSPRLEVELGIPGVRVFALRTSPYVIVSFDIAEFVDVRHVLHSRRDIPDRMTDGRTLPPLYTHRPDTDSLCSRVRTSAGAGRGSVRPWCWQRYVAVRQAGAVNDLADALMRGPRGRRLCLEYVSRADDAVRTAVFWLGREFDPPGTLLSFVGDDSDPEPDPTFSGDDVAALIDAVDLTEVRGDVVREALQASVDFARYWQEPDGADAGAALPPVRHALRRVAQRLVSAIPDLTAPRGQAQWAVEWHPLADSAPLTTEPAAVLAEWTRAQRAEEERSAIERPRDPHANWSGTWWSVPQTLLETRSRVADALELVEDSLGWEIATIIPVRGAGRTLEIQTPEDWAELCRTYPMEVTASRRHDWFRVTGRDGRWLIPDWERVAGPWDAVHLTTLGYLSAATRLIEIDSEYGSVIGGWAPDSTIWLTDVAREGEPPRQEWTRPHDDWRWRATDLPTTRGR
ncbi:type II toxin-antitoxin system RelE/ParE family toxin [Microbacterium aquimaris]|uniref:type II toxin-antitoxin system RelE/ParE family toxin n=1 Tax=Microbacterium aquimaris TaxID=459816 RepID=UPI002AD33408|nr:type II toxin-antitoxin system RelE/ParE family toxin [Microbacterium aquimaris]MDZ8275368.1 type II toxin-antitoxin system RelE/ParE family toxin [Microbacterium aquimaris]